MVDEYFFDSAWQVIAPRQAFVELYLYKFDMACFDELAYETNMMW